jgi:trk system potassium uptake protein TrkH
VLFIAVALLTADVLLNGPDEYDTEKALRDSTFQAVSIMTTTGYGTADFNAWPDFSRWLLLLLMFVGGCAGSTGGGIKVIRTIVFAKAMFMEITGMFRPRVVRTLKIGTKVLDKNVIRNVIVYVGVVLIIFLISTLLIFVLHNDYCVDKDKQVDIETAISSVAATLNNIGPGLNMVGSTKNYAFFSTPAKIFLSLLMILGRLEIMVILCLLVPSFWKKE